MCSLSLNERMVGWMDGWMDGLIMDGWMDNVRKAMSDASIRNFKPVWPVQFVFHMYFRCLFQVLVKT
jgi:hypothetical protein